MRGDRVKASGQGTLMEVMAVATALDQEVSTGTETREHLGLGDRSAEGGGSKAEPPLSEPGEWAPLLVTEQVWGGGTELRSGCWEVLLRAPPPLASCDDCVLSPLKGWLFH